MKSLAPGFLISMPQLGDPHFHRSVVLMIEHGEAGSMGLTIHRAAALSLKDLAKSQQMPLADHRADVDVFSGGPVEPQRGFLLHDCAELEEKSEILPGLFFSLSEESLRTLLVHPTAKIRFFLGYAGWGPRQLEHELEAGSWLFSEANARSVLEGSPGTLWDETVRAMGVDPAMLLMGKGLH